MSKQICPPAPPELGRGVLLVALGSASYGILSTFVKLAYRDGFTTAEVITAQFAWGLVALAIWSRWLPRGTVGPTSGETRQLAWAGTTTGLTSVFYYICVTHTPASVAVVFLMQSIWMGVVVESLQRRQWPGRAKLIAVSLVWIGTLFATNAFEISSTALNRRGIVFGILSALSYTATLAATGGVATRVHPVHRARCMLYGGAVITFGFAGLTQVIPYQLGWFPLSADLSHAEPFRGHIFFSYGVILALFGTILPPVLLNAGFPKTGVGLGSIVSSIELPFATLVAFTLLGERTSLTQIVGISMILAAVMALNFRALYPSRG